MENLKVSNLNQEKKLPSNVEAEQALLGSVLVNNDIIDEVSNITNHNECYDPLHSKIYSSIENLITKE
jgi:Replicative DNA helicase